MDPIADMLARIKNAQGVLKEEVLIPYSKLKFQIAKILESRGFVEEAEKVGRHRKQIRIRLKYNEEKEPRIRGMKRVSKQGQRIYKGARGLRPVRGGFGVGIVSTSKGLMTISEAKKKNLGGEIICEVW